MKKKHVSREVKDNNIDRAAVLSSYSFSSAVDRSAFINLEHLV